MLQGLWERVRGRVERTFMQCGNEDPLCTLFSSLQGAGFVETRCVVPSVVVTTRTLNPLTATTVIATSHVLLRVPVDIATTVDIATPFRTNVVLLSSDSF
jgi:hypothetical protein